MGFICEHSQRDSLRKNYNDNNEIHKSNEITDSENTIISSKRIESNKIKNDIKNSNNNSNNNSIINSKMSKSIKNINDIKDSNNNTNNNSINNTSKNFINSKMSKSIKNINEINNSNNNNSINNTSTNNNIKNNKDKNSYIFKSYDEPISQNDQKIISVGLDSDSRQAFLKQLRGEVESKNLSDSTSKKTIKIIEFNFKEIENPLIERNREDNVGCGQHSINTFCLFRSFERETYLVYSVKNSMKKYIRIYALNMDTNEKTILEEHEEIYKNNIVDENRHIPTQIRHFIIEQDEYIIAGYRDSSIFVWELVNSGFNLILKNEKKGEPIKGISLFKNKINNELTIISSERGNQQLQFQIF